MPNNCKDSDQSHKHGYELDKSKFSPIQQFISKVEVFLEHRRVYWQQAVIFYVEL